MSTTTARTASASVARALYAAIETATDVGVGGYRAAAALDLFAEDRMNECPTTGETWKLWKRVKSAAEFVGSFAKYSGRAPYAELEKLSDAIDALSADLPR